MQHIHCSVWRDASFKPLAAIFFLTLNFLRPVIGIAQPPPFSWVSKAGSASEDRGNDVGVDAAGNTYVTGWFSGTATFGGTNLTSRGLQDIFVAKYDSTGKLIWARQAGGNSSLDQADQGYGIAVDGAGNSYVTGRYFDNATFDTITLTNSGAGDIFLTKYDSGGNLVWVQRAGGSSGDYGYGIAVDTGGNTYITGIFQATATFGHTNLTASGDTDIFIAKYDTAGNVLWAKQAGGSGYDFGKGIGMDTAGNIYVTGSFTGTATFGVTNVISSGNLDIFVAKYGNAGELLWVRQAGGSLFDEGRDLAVDAAGNIYVTGYFQDVASFGNTNLTSIGSYDMFIAKYDSAGNLLWVKQAGGILDTGGYGVAVDEAYNSYVTGFFQGSATFGSSNLVSGGYDGFVAKYDNAGEVVWVIQAGGSTNDYGNSIVLDAAGNIYVTGAFQSTATFGTVNQTSGGDYDMFVAKIDGVPSLDITRMEGQVVLSWPVWATGFHLESVRSLSASNSWSAVTNTPAIIGEQNYVTNQISNVSQFYRLRKS